MLLHYLGNIMGNIFRVARVDKTATKEIMDEERRELEAVGGIIEAYDCMNEDDIIRSAADADVLTTDGLVISKRVLESLPKCQAVIRRGVGYDVVDVEAATSAQIMVVNIPDFCWEEVSNHVIMLMLAQAKKLIKLNSLVKAGKWAEAKAAQAPMACIHGETLGIIGCGKIGKFVARKARCLGMEVIGYDKYLSVEAGAEAGITMVSYADLLQRSDYITLHTPLCAETFHMLGESELAQVKPTVTIINTSRGPTIDEPALIRALQERRVAAACLDVFEQEPIDPANPLLQMDQVTLLPHCASYSEAAFSLLRTNAGKEEVRIARGMMPKSLINTSDVPKVRLTPYKPDTE